MQTLHQRDQRSGTTRGHNTTRWLRIGLPVLLVLAWVALGGMGGSFFPRVNEVSTNNQSAYLPDSADSTAVQNRLADFTDTGGVPAVVVVTGSGSLTQAQLAQLRDLPPRLEGVTGVTGTPSPPILSKDGHAAEIIVPVNSGKASDAATAIRGVLNDHLPSGTHAWITGPGGFLADMVSALLGIDGLLLGVALLAVFVILVLVYRSPLLPVLVLATSMLALSSSLFVVWWLAKWKIVLLSGQVQGILFILVIGATTDYALLYVSRFREALQEGLPRWDAAWRAWRGAFEPIVASGGTVIVGLLCLLLSDLLSNRALGPIGAIGIAIAVLAALTFLPALLALAGRVAFWPFAPRVAGAAATGELPTRGFWAHQARLVSRRPRVVWVVCTLALLAVGSGVLQLSASGVPQSDLVVGHSEARSGQQVLGEHFDAGSGSPVYLLVPQDKLAATVGVVDRVPGLAGVAAAAKGSPSGQVGVSVVDGELSYRAPAVPGAPVPEPTLSRGDVLLSATLTDPADSDAASAVVRQLRAELNTHLGHEVVKVGGVTATSIDSNDTSIRDRNLIIPVILVVIFLILMLLLRSVLAPALLIGSVIVSYTAALGVSALVFNHLFHFAGADPAVPLYGFVFLVALGVDYNIFLMTRVREEAATHGTRPGVLRGLIATGGVITSAGVILAATFTALSVIPILFLVQIAFMVAFGVLLDTFVVRSLLVPALSYDVGRAIWWPSRLWRHGPEEAVPAPRSEAESAVTSP